MSAVEVLRQLDLEKGGRGGEGQMRVQQLSKKMELASKVRVSIRFAVCLASALPTHPSSVTASHV